jgi:protein ImuB
VAWAGPWVLDERWWDPLRHRRAARFQFVTVTGRAYVASIERQQWWLVAEYG